MQPSAPMTHQEIQQLENWLASPMFSGKAMPLDRLQGFLAAVVSSPDIILPSVWMPEVLGCAPTYDSMEQAQAFMDLLMRFYNEVASTLPDKKPLKLILKPKVSGEPDMDYQSWCEGYISGWSLSKEEWLRPGNEPLKKLTFPILFLSGAFREAAEFSGQKYIPDADDLKVQQDCVAMLPQAVTGIYNFWLTKRRLAPSPARRETPKVGRNELCPCGSGKKFKQCCGANRIVH
ncbi:UPF0149 family protein [Sulfuriferula multivorans]|nr:UPF0149 family protein [Sulfuriferula multivorans]